MLPGLGPLQPLVPPDDIVTEEAASPPTPARAVCAPMWACTCALCSCARVCARVCALMWVCVCALCSCARVCAPMWACVCALCSCARVCVLCRVDTCVHVHACVHLCGRVCVCTHSMQSPAGRWGGVGAGPQAGDCGRSRREGSRWPRVAIGDRAAATYPTCPPVRHKNLPRWSSALHLDVPFPSGHFRRSSGDSR